jgi:multidrug efflux pump subunit AcrA (membrane-fusion protein)
MNPRVVLLPLAVLLVGAGIAILSKGRAPAPAPVDGKGPAPPADGKSGAAGVPTGPWHAQNIRTHLVPSTERIPCRVLAPEPVTLLPTIASTPVETIVVREGQAVRKGDVLLTFSGAQWERARAAAEKSGDAGKLAEAKRALASLEVRAPGDGIVYAMNARRGERPLSLNGTPSPLVVLFDWRQLS